MLLKRAEDFFAYARERHAIYLRRYSGLPWPWTEDPILQQYKFTNIFRELDRTTVWFAQNVRKPLQDRPEVLLATVLFRWFNRIATGEAIFRQPSLGLGREKLGETAWDTFLRIGGSSGVNCLRQAIQQYCGKGPYVTGAYMIKSPTGMNKLDGMLDLIDRFNLGAIMYRGEATSWRTMAARLLTQPGEHTLEGVWGWLKEFDLQGPFLAYEVITDLRYTALLDRAPDIMTWANPGPGALRGAGRILDTVERHQEPSGKWIVSKAARDETMAVMRGLLELSRDPSYWPQIQSEGIFFHENYKKQLKDVLTDDPKYWPAWEMREVEHTLCEFDKYERVRLGHGRPRSVYKVGG